MVRAYERRRKIIYEGLNAIDGVACILPESTFYAFPNKSGFGLTSWELAKYLVKEHRVAVVPGSIFGNNGEGYIRISFAMNSQTLKEGISRIKKGLEAL
jgi:aspartate/methionine/tyrosine aminotransferase